MSHKNGIKNWFLLYTKQSWKSLLDCIGALEQRNLRKLKQSQSLNPEKINPRSKRNTLRKKLDRI